MHAQLVYYVYPRMSRDFTLILIKNTIGAFQFLYRQINKTLLDYFHVF